MTLKQFFSRAAKKRWLGVSKKERSKLMRAAALKSHEKRRKKK